MNKQKKQHYIKKQRAYRTRAVMHGTAICPRISVHKSNTQIYVQCIDDDVQKTIVGGSTAAQDLRTSAHKERVQKLIVRIAAGLKEKNITKAVFDRGAYRFHGTVKMVADELRTSGIRI